MTHACIDPDWPTAYLRGYRETWEKLAALQPVALEDNPYAEGSHSAELWRRGALRAAAEHEGTTLYIPAHCAWHRSPGNFLLTERQFNSQPALYLSSPLRPEPGKEGCFDGDGALFNVEHVRKFRDKLSAWLRKQGAE